MPENFINEIDQEASNIWSLVNKSTEIDVVGILQTFLLRFPIGNRTIFQNIRRTHSFQENTPPIRATKMDNAEAISNIHSIIKESAIQELAGGKVVIFLSYGLDSNIALQAILRAKPECITAITVGNSNYSEHEVVEKIATLTGIKLIKIHLSDEEFINNLHLLAGIFNNPIAARDAVCFSYAAVNYVKDSDYNVLASGTGADELFDGYDQNKFYPYVDKGLSGNHKIHDFASQWCNNSFFGSRGFLNQVLNPSIDLNKVVAEVENTVAATPLLNSQLSYRALHRIIMTTIRLASYEGVMFEQLAQHIGLKHWSPFMSRKLLKFCMSLDDDHFLSKNGYTKALLRECFSQTLPSLIRKNKKLPTKPLSLWQTECFKNSVLEAVYNGHISQLNLLVPSEIERVLSLPPTVQNYNLKAFFFKFLVIEEFLKRFDDIQKNWVNYS